MRQLKVMRILRVEEGVAFLKGQFIQSVLERVEVLITGPIDPAAVRQLETVHLVGLESQTAGGEEVQVRPFYIVIIRWYIGRKIPFGISLFGAQS